MVLIFKLYFYFEMKMVRMIEYEVNFYDVILLYYTYLLQCKGKSSLLKLFSVTDSVWELKKPYIRNAVKRWTEHMKMSYHTTLPLVIAACQNLSLSVTKFSCETVHNLLKKVICINFAETMLILPLTCRRVVRSK